MPASRSPYGAAGVDLDAARAVVDGVRPLARATARAGTVGEIGGFGGLFDPRAAGYDDPILVAAADGVGTKLDVAVATGRHRGIGVDLVAMCVNDVVVQGAEPLFFLDYFAAGRLSGALVLEVLEGVAAGCAEAGCALIGGETAEMPGLYPQGAYDLAGFAVGAAERGTLLDGAGIAEGCIVLGLASDGLHANGFSLVRRIAAEAGLGYDDPAPFAEGRLGEVLLAPTRIYVRAALAAHRAGLLRGLAHITGGGLIDNLARILPPGLAAELDPAAWDLPEVFRWLAETGRVAPAELARTFNCGVGMAVVAAPGAAGAARRLFEAEGERVFEIGVVAPRTPGLPAVTLADGGVAWPG